LVPLEKDRVAVGVAAGSFCVVLDLMLDVSKAGEILAVADVVVVVLTVIEFDIKLIVADVVVVVLTVADIDSTLGVSEIEALTVDDNVVLGLAEAVTLTLPDCVGVGDGLQQFRTFPVTVSLSRIK